MMTKNFPLNMIAVMGCLFMPAVAHADGDSVPINYDSLSFVEEPMAFEIGPATVSVNTIIDQAIQYSTQAEDEDYNTRAISDLSIETELPNTAQLKIRYVANYDRLRKDSYKDDVAVSLSDEWGTLAAGNVTGSVYELSKRKSSFGNGELANDNFVGALDEDGGFYTVQYNSYRVSVAADKEGRAEAGVSFTRPIGKQNYFASLRARKGDTGEDPGDTVTAVGASGDTYGAAAVAQVTYASFLADVQVGYENVDLDNQTGSNDHAFGSVGMQYKQGAYRFSAEGGVGRYDGDDRRAAALGSRVDVARGVSLNLGVNYKYENDDDDVTSIGSVRYEF